MKLYSVQLDLCGGKGRKSWDFPETFNVVAAAAEDAINGAKQHAHEQYKDLSTVTLLSVYSKSEVDLVY